MSPAEYKKERQRRGFTQQTMNNTHTIQMGGTPTRAATHTPGPWHAFQQTQSNHWQVWPVDNPTGRPFVCGVTDGPWSGANARLIAASPDLLEACRAIVGLARGQGRANMLEVAGLARAAIAKAEGGDT